MRILFFADNFPPEVNAPATHIYERSRIWVEQGHDVTVITCVPNFPGGTVHEGYRNALRQVEIVDGIRVVRVWTFIAPNRGTLRRSLDYISFVPSALVASLIETRPDVIISSSPHLMVPVAGVACSTLRRVPHVFELRDLWPASMAAAGALREGSVMRMLERLERLLYRRSRRVLSFTESFREDLVARGTAEEKIDVIYGGASDSVRSPDAPRDRDLEEELNLQDRFVVGYIGTLGLAHGLENAIDAMATLKDQPVSLLLVGDGAEKPRLEDRARAAELSNVQFVDLQPKDQLARYWSMCDAALVHLKDDPVFATVVPSKIFEAMSCGKPIIFAGPVGEASRLIARHEVGVIVPAMATGALAEAINGLAEDKTRHQRLAENSAAAAANYTRSKQAERTLEVLAKAVSQR